MQKLKNLINPGGDQDDEVMYGSGHAPGNLGGIHSGNPDATVAAPHHGSNDQPSVSHDSNSKSQFGNDGNTTGSSDTAAYPHSAGPHSSDLANKADPRVDSDLDRSSARGTDHTTDSSQTAGPHTSNLANKADPRVDSDHDRSSNTRTTEGTPAAGAVGATDQHQRSADDSFDSGLPGAFPSDSASTTAVKSGVPGKDTGLAGPTHHNDGATYGSTAEHLNKPLPSTPASSKETSGLGSTSQTAGSTIPTSSTHGGNQQQSQTAESHLGRDAAFGTAAAAGATAVAHHNETGTTHNQTNNPDAEAAARAAYTQHQPQSGIAGESQQGGRTIPLAGHSTTRGQESGSTTQHREAGVATTSTTAPHSSNLANKADPRVDSNTDESRTGAHGGIGTQLGGNTGLATGAPGHFVPGPHDTDTANLLDPKLDGIPGYGLDEGVVRTAQTSTTAAGNSTAGPHKSNLLNKADPRVDSDLDGSRTAGSVPGTEGNVQDRGPHSGRSTGTTAGSTAAAGLIAGQGPEGLHASESRPDHPSTGPASKTAGPHKSNLLNKLDPRVDSDLDGSKTAGSVPGTAGNVQTGPFSGKSPYSSAAVDPRIDSSSGNQAGAATSYGSTGPSSSEKREQQPSSTVSESHHTGRDAAALGAGGAIAGHETSKHEWHPQDLSSTQDQRAASGYPEHASEAQIGQNTAGDSSRVHEPQIGQKTAVGSSQAQPTTSGNPDRSNDHHYGRDAAVFGAGGAVAGHELLKDDRHPQEHGNVTGYPDRTRDTQSSRDANTGGAFEQRSAPTQSEGSSSHHYGRDAAVVGAGGTAAGYEPSKNDKQAQEQSGLTSDQHTSGNTTAGGASDQSTTLGHPDRSNDHLKHRDAAVVGVGGATAGHELSKHEKRSQEKELAKQEKAAEKEQKHHDKDHHEKKEHHSLLGGLLHRRKDHKDTDKERDHEKDAHHGRDAALAGGAGGAAYEAEKHDHSKGTDGIPTSGTSSTGNNTHNSAVDSNTGAGVNDQVYGDDRHTGRDAALGAGAAGAASEGNKHQHGDGRNRLHKDPPASIAAAQSQGQTAGDQTTTGDNNRDTLGRDNQTSGDHNLTGTDRQGSLVKEPITQLPMDLSKGSGAGGTDSGPISGYHEGASGAETGHSTTAGPHSSNLANKADPLVDSDQSRTGT